MALSVKQKIQYGTVFLFVLLILTGGVGIYFTVNLKNETKTVLKDNYESIAYCHIMQQKLDSLPLGSAETSAGFEAALKKQEHNITEPGEGEVTQNLRLNFNALRTGDTSTAITRTMRSDIQQILALNMNAIHVKDAKVGKTAKDAVTFIVFLVVVIVIVAFTFSYNFPAVLTNPIKELSDGIKAITNKNYQHRININNTDEFGTLARAFNEMAQRLEHFENSNLNKIMFEKNRAEAVINSLKDASIGIDKSNTILFANYQALQLLGLKSQDIIGKQVSEVAKINDLFHFLVDSDSSTPFKVVVNNRENYFTKEVLEVTQGEGNSRVIVLKNITSFKELDVAKTNFIATISHELKTPLAASDFSLTLLEDERIGKLSGEQKELIQNLKQDNQRVLKILSELLNMSQVEAGRIELNIQSVNPYLIVDNAIETVTAAAKEKKITIKKVMEDNLPFIHADADKNTWVLNNFLTNAIKYSPEEGEIIVSAKRIDGSLRFSVQDFGPGIPAEYLPRIFERYFQVPGSKHKGTGLGLGISKEFIESQKGKIWAESEIGKGSVFSFSLAV